MMYKIVTMVESDIEAVALIESELFSDGWSKESLLSSLQQDNVKMLVAKYEDRIIGYHIFYMSLDEGEIARIAVDFEYRRMGVAEELLEKMWIYSRSVGITRVLLEVRESNEKAIALYKKQGFQKLGLRKNYYTKPLEHGVIMEKRLDITTSI